MSSFQVSTYCRLPWESTSQPGYPKESFLAPPLGAADHSERRNHFRNVDGGTYRAWNRRRVPLDAACSRRSSSGNTPCGSRGPLRKLSPPCKPAAHTSGTCRRTWGTFGGLRQSGKKHRVLTKKRNHADHWLKDWGWRVSSSTSACGVKKLFFPNHQWLRIQELLLCKVDKLRTHSFVNRGFQTQTTSQMFSRAISCRLNSFPVAFPGSHLNEKWEEENKTKQRVIYKGQPELLFHLRCSNIWLLSWNRQFEVGGAGKATKCHRKNTHFCTASTLAN